MTDTIAEDPPIVVWRSNCSENKLDHRLRLLVRVLTTSPERRRI